MEKEVSNGIVRTVKSPTLNELEFLMNDLNFNEIIESKFLGPRVTNFGDALFRDAVNLLNHSGKKFKSLGYDTKNRNVDLTIIVFDLYSPFPVLTFLLDQMLNEEQSKKWPIYTVTQLGSTLNNKGFYGSNKIRLTDRCRFISGKDFRSNKHVIVNNNLVIYTLTLMPIITEYLSKLRQPWNTAADIFGVADQRNTDKLHIELQGLPHSPMTSVVNTGDLYVNCKNVMLHYEDVCLLAPS